MSKRESVECRAFHKCFPVLADGISNPGQLAVQLYSKKLIGPDILREAQKQVVEEREKIVKLLSAVEEQIVVSPATNFREFLDVLQNEPSLQLLSTRLKNTYQELVSVPPIHIHLSYTRELYLIKANRDVEMACQKYDKVGMI